MKSCDLRLAQALLFGDVQVDTKRNSHPPLLPLGGAVSDSCVFRQFFFCFFFFLSPKHLFFCFQVMECY